MAATDVPERGLAVPRKEDSGELRIAVSPVGDVQAFAERIDFARVVSVDEETRTVVVELRSEEGAPAAGANP